MQWSSKSKFFYSVHFGLPYTFFGYGCGYPISYYLSLSWWYPYACYPYYPVYYPGVYWTYPFVCAKPVNYYCDAYCPPKVVYQKEVVHHVYHAEGDGGAVGAQGLAAQASADSAEEIKKLTPAEQYEKLGDLFFRSGKYEQAAIAYEKAIRENPARAALQFILADARFAMGDYHGAALAIRRGVELEPLLVEAEIDKRAFYEKPEDFDLHLAALRRFLDERPADTDALFVLAYNLHFSGQRGEAKKVFEQVLEANQKDFAVEIFLAAK